MSKWQRQFSFEFAMIFRNPWFLAMPVLFGAFNVWGIGKLQTSEMFQGAYSFHAVVHTMTLGLVMLLGILTVRRDIRRPSYEWSGVLPVSYASRLLAKYITGLIYFTVFTLFAGSVFAWFSVQTGVDNPVTVEYTRYFVATYEVSYIVTLALAMLLAICIPNRVVYLIGFCAWMFGTFFMDIFLISKGGLYFLRTFHLSGFLLTQNLDNEVGGIRLISDELFYSRLFVLSFSLLLLAAGVMVLNLLRPTKHRTSGLAACGFVLLLAYGAFIPYGLIWQERYAQYNEKLNDRSTLSVNDSALQLKNDAPAGKYHMYKISDYRIDLRRAPDDGLQAIVRLRIPAGELKGKTVLPLTLNRAFSVKNVSVNGAEVRFTHQGDQLTAKLPAAANGRLEIEMNYSGTMMDYSSEFGNQSFYAYVKGNNVFLPGYIAWYPLPGYQPVYMKQFDEGPLKLGITHSGAVNVPADFSLTTSGFESALFASMEETGRQGDKQTFEVKGAEGINLYGGVTKEAQNPAIPLRIVTTPYNEKRSGEILDALSGFYAYYSSWIGNFKPKVNQVIYLPFNNYIKSEIENRTYQLTWFIGPDTEYVTKLIMNAMLMGTRSGDYLIDSIRQDIRLQLRGLLWYVYLREQEEGSGDQEIEQRLRGDYMLRDMYFTSPEIDPDHLAMRMVQQVSRELDEGKYKPVKEVLSFFYDKGLEVKEIVPEKLDPKHKIPYSDWEREWKKVMGDESRS